MDTVAVAALACLTIGFLVVGLRGQKDTHDPWLTVGVIVVLAGLVLATVVCLRAVNAPYPWLLALGPTPLAYLAGSLARKVMRGQYAR